MLPRVCEVTPNGEAVPIRGIFLNGFGWHITLERRALIDMIFILHEFISLETDEEWDQEIGRAHV